MTFAKVLVMKEFQLQKKQERTRRRHSLASQLFRFSAGQRAT